MKDLIILLVFGAFVIVMGIVNMCGNVSTLHRYHRSRVAPENVKPFGRLVGLGTVFCGAGIMLFGTLDYLAATYSSLALTVVGIVLLVISLVAGLGLSFYAMKKYNGGIFR